MGNTFGNNLKLTLFGESHGSSIGVIIDNVPSGIKIDFDYIDKKLALRKPQDLISTTRKEEDSYRFVSGVFNNFTTGSPICVLIDNKDVDDSKYEKIKDIPRPGHADYAAHIKYDGFEDYRGGGHFSGRLTAPLVIAGSIFSNILEQKGIKIGTHISYSRGINDDEFSENLEKDIEILNNKLFPCINDEKGNEIRKEIINASNEKDSIGAILQTAIIGLPTGLGEPWFDNVESMLSHALFSIPAVKGIEFGAGFKFADLKGSQANDSFRIKNDRVITTTNNNAGINGGITNGQPIIFNTVIKPTPSIGLKQETINMKTLENETLQIEGRHDPAIFPRARVVVDSLSAFVIADLLISVYGKSFFVEA